MNNKTVPPALFVYIPYCPFICTYCDFNVYAGRTNEYDAYVDALVREIEITAQAIPTPRVAKSLALGGGTPSLFSAEQLRRIVAAVRRHFEFIPNAEWTLEANPGTVDAGKLNALVEMGFTRLSLGVQTFDDERLRQFNRHHTVGQSYEAFTLARQAGFKNLNLDLIYGLPGQVVGDWDDTIERALAFQSEHLSLYGLQVEEGTALKKQIELGRAAQPDSDAAAEMYELAVEKLGKMGLNHYEISNFSRPGYESKHNQTYWLNEPYLGFGAGAHSLWAGERYENVRAPKSYIESLRGGALPRASSEIISREMEMAETIFLGLRLTEGVAWSRFTERFAVDARKVYAEQIQILRGQGVLIVDERGMRLTEQGMLLSNQLLWRFLPD